ncbi:hypothetical protein KEM56_003437 [Ascosphaera pollenicola]|nr:hypothetical protein KEM56_003437 [Ascosphaera pollenicola]
MSFRGATASAATVPEFALTGSHEFPSPSPPPSRRHPQPLMAPLAGLTGYPNQTHMASVHEDQVSAATAGFTNLGAYSDASPTMPQWYFGDEVMPMSGPVQGQERSGVRFSVGSGDGYQEGWQGQFM